MADVGAFFDPRVQEALRRHFAASDPEALALFVCSWNFSYGRSGSGFEAIYRKHPAAAAAVLAAVTAYIRTPPWEWSPGRVVSVFGGGGGADLPSWGFVEYLVSLFARVSKMSEDRLRREHRREFKRRQAILDYWADAIAARQSSVTLQAPSR